MLRASVVVRTLAAAATIFYLLAVIPFCPHVEAWKLHAGCVLLLAAVWGFALRPARCVSLRAALLTLCGACMICVGLADMRRVRTSMEKQLRMALVDQYKALLRVCTCEEPSTASLVESVRGRDRDWRVSVILALERLNDPHALVYGLREPPLLEPSYRRSVLGTDLIGYCKARLAQEAESLLIAERARTHLLAIVDQRR